MKRTVLSVLIVAVLFAVAAMIAPLLSGTATAKCSKSITTGKTLYEANCLSCHGEKGKVYRINRESKKSFTKSVLNGEDEDEGESSMPSFSGSLSKKKIYKIWSYLRKPKKACSGGGGGVVTNPTYDADIKSILSTYCTACHQGSSPSGGISLDTYADASANASAIKTSVDAGGTMPPSGSLSSNLVTTIDNWVNNGAPQN